MQSLRPYYLRSTWRFLIFLLLSLGISHLCAPLLVYAQPPLPYLVKDINPTPGVGSFPGGWMRGVTTEGTILTVGNQLYFSATDPLHGEELWKSDGTETGTQLIKDIWPGPGSSIPYAMTVFKGMVYFFADDGSHGWELWKTDGTEAGTQLVKDILPGPEPTFASLNSEAAVPMRSMMTAVGDWLYFAADDGIHGFEPWKTDGTEAGTQLLKDIKPGEQTSLHAYETRRYSLNGILYFVADDGVHGNELWRSDGTESGTQLVKDFTPGSASGFDVLFGVVMDGAFYFSGYDGVQSAAIWRITDVSAAPQLVTTLPAPPYLFAAGSHVFYFAVNGGLWRSDGTSAGTRNFQPIPDAGIVFTPVQAGNWVYFILNRGNGAPYEFWKSDGVTFQELAVPVAGTQPVVLAGGVYFVVIDAAGKPQLWRSDGTTDVTEKIAALWPLQRDADLRELAVVGNRLFFPATTPETGNELWVLPPGGAANSILGDQVWRDLNRNGIQEDGELYLSNRTVHLLQGCTGSTVLATGVTDVNGWYIFEGLAAGQYRVQFEVLAGEQVTRKQQGANRATDSDANADGVTDCITLAAGQTDATWDAGLYAASDPIPPPPSTLGDQVWRDLNRNGVQEDGEPYLPNMTVHLLAGCTGNTVRATGGTDANGWYTFYGLAAGQYRVQFAVPSGQHVTLKQQGSNRATDSDANPDGVTDCLTLTAGQTDATWDAGLYADSDPLPPLPSALGDQVWWDLNRNGVQDAGEPYLPEMSVHLLQGCTGNTVLANGVTDGNGWYTFYGLAAGPYRVQFDLPANRQFTLKQQGSDRATDSDVNPNGVTDCLTLAAGQTDATWDAGIYAPVAATQNPDEPVHLYLPVVVKP